MGHLWEVSGMRRSVWTGLLLCVVAASLLFAEAVGVRKHTLWEVP